MLPIRVMEMAQIFNVVRKAMKLTDKTGKFTQFAQKIRDSNCFFKKILCKEFNRNLHDKKSGTHGIFQNFHRNCPGKLGADVSPNFEPKKVFKVRKCKKMFTINTTCPSKLI